MKNGARIQLRALLWASLVSFLIYLTSNHMMEANTVRDPNIGLALLALLSAIITIASLLWALILLRK